MRSSAWVRAMMVLLALLPVSRAVAQDAEDRAIDAIRRLPDVGPNDQRQIKNWINKQLDKLVRARPPAVPRKDGFHTEAFKTFRSRIREQLDNDQNTPAFLAQFAEQMTIVALERFARPGVDSSVLRGLARTLIDVNSAATVPGLIAGLQVADAGARFLCARGLTAQRRAIAQDANRLQQVTEALGAAGSTERNAAILGRIYEALALPNQVAAVFPIYLQIFDARLEHRRANGTGADWAEVFAFDYLRDVAVPALSNEQRIELAQRLAVYLRLDAVRYNDPSLATPADPEAPDLGYDERVVLERRLDSCEAILEALVGNGRGGDIRGQLTTGGHDARQGVLDEAQKWVGNAESGVEGALNAAPWSVPVGAP